MMRCAFGRDYIVSKEDSTRISILKFISVCFVLYIHSYTVVVEFAGQDVSFQLSPYVKLVEYYISQVIARYAVPFFFLISSILLFRRVRNWVDVLKKKIHTLVVPYLFWNTFWILIFLFLQNFDLTKSFFSGNHTPILECNLKEWLALYGIGTMYPQDYPLWFMRDLMIVIIASPLIWKIVDNFPKTAFVLTILWIIFNPLVVPFGVAFQFFFLGACVVRLEIRLSAFDKYPMYIITMIYIFMSIMAVFVYTSIFKSLFSLVSFIFWIRCSEKICSNKWLGEFLLKLSASTFFIYAAHEMTLSSIKKICARTLPNTSLSALLQYLFIPVFIIIICVVADHILKNIMPGIHKSITGSR